MYQNLSRRLPVVHRSGRISAQVAFQALPLLTMLLMLVLLVDKPAHAGHWKKTVTGQGADIYTVDWWFYTTTYTVDWASQNALGHWYHGYGSPTSLPIVLNSSSSGTVTIALDWVTDSENDPPPSVIYLSEKAWATISEAVPTDSGCTSLPGSANDGFGDPYIPPTNFSPIAYMPYAEYLYSGSSSGTRYEAFNSSSGHVVTSCTQSADVQLPVLRSACGAQVGFDVTVIPPPPLNISSTDPANPKPIVWKPSTMTSVPISATIIDPTLAQLTVTCSIYDSTQTLLKTLTKIIIPNNDPTTVSFSWDGSVDGSPTPSPAGVYLFRFNASSSSESDTDKSTSLSISAPSTNAQLVSNDGNTAQFAVSYTLFSTYAHSAATGKIDVYDASPSVVATQTLGDADLTPGLHTVNISIPSSAVDIDGHNTFLVSAQDNEADADTAGHRKRWALQHNQKGPSLPPIVYIKSDIWHVAWCRKNKPVGLSTESIEPSNRVTHAVKHIVQGGATLPNTVVAASNGSLYNYNGLSPLGGIGVGTIGHWNYTATFTDRQLFSFGMPASGGGFAYARMKPVRIRVRRKELIKFEVADGIQQGYPYGFGCVGLLVDKGVPRGYNDFDGQWNTLQLSPTSPEPRTALGWTKEGDFFIVTCNGINNTPAGAMGKTWDDVKNFFVTGLPQIIQQKYHTTVATYGAVMLDGGGSTMFGYRNMDQNGNNIQTDQGAPTGLDTQVITDYVLAVGDTSK